MCKKHLIRILYFVDIGSFVLRTSVDEISQLVNVVKGYVSLVLARLLLPEYLSLFNEEQKKRRNVNLGITGGTRVNAINAISWKQKFEYDVCYVKINFFIRLKSITFDYQKVVASEGISSDTSDTSDTMEKFKGN